MIRQRNRKRRNRLLLHVCCSPCSTVPVEKLKDEFEIVGFFYNPNIYPRDEYELREKVVQKYFGDLGIKYIKNDLPESVNKWKQLVKGFEDDPEGGVRCKKCIRHRIEEAAKYARINKYDCFTTTLSVSPWKDSDFICRYGEEAAKKYRVEFLNEDFSKNNGFQKSIEISKKYKMYRQNYCGCKYSLTL